MTIQLKAVISLVLLVQSFIALVTMLEIMGREANGSNPKLLRLIHQYNGRIFTLVFLVLCYYCYPFLKGTQGAISARALSHSLLALGVIFMLALKISFIKRYKKFMSRVPTFGLAVFLLTIGLVATSGGYYFLVSAEPVKKTAVKQEVKKVEPVLVAKTETPDPVKVKKGEELFNRFCFACHESHTKAQKTGPSLKGVLKKEKLPMTRRDATPENIRLQLTKPYQFMPPQPQLSSEDIENIIEYLKTL